MAEKVTTTVDGEAEDPIDTVEGAVVGAEHAADSDGDDEDG
jgi:hypothetical protein